MRVVATGLKAASLVVALIAGTATLGVLRPGPSSPAPATVRAVTPYPPLLGIVGEGRTRELGRIDPDTLRPRRGRRVAVGSKACAPSSGGQACWFVPAWSFAPHRPLLALARHRAGTAHSLRIVDIRRMRVTADVPLAGGAVGAVAWLTPKRLLAIREICCEERQQLVAVDPARRRVVARRPLGGAVQRVAQTPRELLMLVAPAKEIGVARLIVADPDGAVRSVRLERLRAGVKILPGREYRIEQSILGLAVDPEGRRAFVVGPELVADVDLANLAVSYREPTPEASPLSRLLDWLDPPAYAKVVSGSTRSARWLGGGLLAVTGTDEDLVEVPQGGEQIRMRAAGLHLVDTRDWSIRTIDPGAAEVHVAGGLLLATGSSSNPATRRGESIGLVAYGLDGRRRFRRFDSRGVWVRQVYAGRAYVEVPLLRPPWVALRAVDLDAGRAVRMRARPLPWLLVDVASGRWDG
jgi:hypothetical protein